MLLDAFFDNQDLNSPRSNPRTVEYLTAVTQAEGLDLQARRGNPTGQGWAVVGSLNGGEVSAKLDRRWRCRWGRMRFMRIWRTCSGMIGT